MAFEKLLDKNGLQLFKNIERTVGRNWTEVLRITNTSSILLIIFCKKGMISLKLGEGET